MFLRLVLRGRRSSHREPHTCAVLSAFAPHMLALTSVFSAAGVCSPPAGRTHCEELAKESGCVAVLNPGSLHAESLCSPASLLAFVGEQVFSVLVLNGLSR